MKPGDLVRLKEVPPYWDQVGFKIGDLAFFVERDWDETTGSPPIKDKQGRVFTGRGYFFFPEKPNPFNWKEAHDKLGLLCLYECVEVISEAG